jgi:hypothetical protein
MLNLIFNICVWAMLIFSFDAGIKRLGVCVLRVAHRGDRDALDARLRQLAAELAGWTAKFGQPASSAALSGLALSDLISWLAQLRDLAARINAVLVEYISIRFVNTIHLIRETDKVKSVPRHVWIDRLNYALACLGAQFGPPDVVLIERQMTISENINGVSKFIEAQYRPAIECEFTTLNTVYKLDRVVLPAVRYPQIFIVNPIVKNTIDLNKKKSYGDFVARLSNTAANKNHTNASFQHWLDTWGIPLRTSSKTYDSADAFMMAIAMLYRGDLRGV